MNNDQEFIKMVNDNAKRQATLFRGALNDDYVVELNDGLVFKKHNGAKVVIIYYTYANEWGNNVNYKFFKNLDNAIDWYYKNYTDRVLSEGRASLYENDADWQTKLTEDECKEMTYEQIVEKIYDDDAAKQEWRDMMTACLL